MIMMLKKDRLQQHNHQAYIHAMTQTSSLSQSLIKKVSFRRLNSLPIVLIISMTKNCGATLIRGSVTHFKCVFQNVTVQCPAINARLKMRSMTGLIRMGILFFLPTSKTTKMKYMAKKQSKSILLRQRKLYNITLKISRIIHLSRTASILKRQFLVLVLGKEKRVLSG